VTVNAVVHVLLWAGVATDAQAQAATVNAQIDARNDNELTLIGFPTFMFIF